MKVRYGAQQNRANHCCFSEEDGARLHKIIVRYGSINKAREAMKFGKSTMDAARACGRTTKPTYDRVIEAMGREEAKAA